MSYSTYRNLGNRTNDGMDNDSVRRLVPRITSIEEKKRIISMNKIVVLDLYADWCQPCKLIEPRVAHLALKHTYTGVCVFVKENIQDNISNHDDITGIPTFQFYVNGNLVDSVVGADITEVENKLVPLLEGFSR